MDPGLRRDDDVLQPVSPILFFVGYSPPVFGKDQPLMLTIDGPSAWRRADLRSEDYRIDLSSACLDEIRHLADAFRAGPLPTIVRRPALRSSNVSARWRMSRTSRAT